jgi:hypothetical protein
LTRYLNLYLGTNIGPWDLDDIPDIYLATLVEGATLQAQLNGD